MIETLDHAEGGEQRLAALRGLFGGVGELVDVAVEQGHGDTSLVDLPSEVVEEAYQRRHEVDEV